MIFFTTYIRHRIKVILGAVIFMAVFATVFFLYDAPMRPILYGCLISCTLGCILIVSDAVRVSRKIKKLDRVLVDPMFFYGTLKNPPDPVEFKYMEMIEKLADQNVRMRSEMDAGYKEMEEYYTMWAHQIKTPIFAAKLLLDGKEIDKRTIREIDGEMQKIEQYVDMVMGYVRLGSESTDYMIKKVDLDAVIKEIVKKKASQFIEKKIVLNYTEIEKEVLSDEKWLAFVIEQIISNAIKYTEKGSVSIFYEENALVICDTGIGIEQEDLPRIFEKGFTGLNGRTDKKASGIGLYLSKKILEKLGHSIKADSVVGEGTEIRIEFNEEKLDFE